MAWLGGDIVATWLIQYHDLEGELHLPPGMSVSAKLIDMLSHGPAAELRTVRPRALRGAAERRSLTL